MKDKTKQAWAVDRKHRKENAKRWTVQNEAHLRHMFKKSWRWTDHLRRERQRKMLYLMPLILKRLEERRKDSTQ